METATFQDVQQLLEESRKAFIALKKTFLPGARKFWKNSIYLDVWDKKITEILARLERLPKELIAADPIAAESPAVASPLAELLPARKGPLPEKPDGWSNMTPTGRRSYIRRNNTALKKQYETS